ncbi:uncharacterized protein [Leptinotarsa decemlineata]|uniref:uncharacterized protein n=1 Tax=Leptinotarsa decemlineata TaxID=7539 RepID=UPI003D30D236
MHGKTKTCRVFLDAGSQAHFITESVAMFLNLDCKPVTITVSGLDNTSTTVNQATTAIIKSRHNKFQKTIEFFIVPQISAAMPSITIDPSSIEIPKNIHLADPEFYKVSPVDALIVVKLFYKLLSIGQISLKNHPNAVLQKTQLGWIIAGELRNQPSSRSIVCHLGLHSPSSQQELTRFWEIEELPSSKALSPEEEACEEHYKLRTSRNDSGRYVVKLPSNNQIENLGTSHSAALRRLHILENKFSRNPELQRDYSAFLAEYKDLNHMSIIPEHENNSVGFYLPHHVVLKQDNVTTKIRVVFDGSAKSSTGISLNDTLMVGPKLQDDLFVILTRFRSHIYAFTADIEKMYRQILVDPIDARYQKIVHRDHPRAVINTYVLNTLTYGTACASHLAVRSLYQLAHDEGHLYPLAAVVLTRDFYVDDVLTGANTHEEASCLRDQLVELLGKGGFNLRKWASNEPSLIVNGAEHPTSTHMSLDLEASIKTLGIRWNARKDTLFYSVNIVA